MCHPHRPYLAGPGNSVVGRGPELRSVRASSFSRVCARAPAARPPVAPAPGHHCIWPNPPWIPHQAVRRRSVGGSVGPWPPPLAPRALGAWAPCPPPVATAPGPAPGRGRTAVPDPDHPGDLTGDLSGHWHWGTRPTVARNSGHPFHLARPGAPWHRGTRSPVASGPPFRDTSPPPSTPWHPTP